MASFNWMPDSKVGDYFRWDRDGEICRITRFEDAEMDVYFVHVTGPRKGQHGYTTLPQDVELLTVLDLIALGLDPSGSNS